MPFYKKKITYEQIQPLTQKLRDWMRQECTVLHELDEEGIEVFYLTPQNIRFMCDNYYNIYSYIMTSGFAQIAPLDKGSIVYWYPKANGEQATVTKTHVRLPKLSHLITLCPNDFFDLIRLVITAKNAPSGDALSLNPAALGIHYFESTIIYEFFAKLRTNFRFSLEYADHKWTSRAALANLKHLEVTYENQLSAMQYLTACQNADLLYFPALAAVNLELELESINNNYCVPPGLTAAGPWE